MDRNEKLLLLQLFLNDIRGNCIWERDDRDRSQLALELSKELDLPMHTSLIEEYRGQVNKDGRIFRTLLQYGGYKSMSTMHGLSHSLKDKSEDFRKLSHEYLTHPEYAFDDY